MKDDPLSDRDTNKGGYFWLLPSWSHPHTPRLQLPTVVFSAYSEQQNCLHVYVKKLDCASNGRPNKMCKSILIFTNIPYYPTYMTNTENNKSIGNSLR